ncbi:hypothetical protein [Arthrobacter sp. P2b]|uniref:hypothetical protein n=1 Tax=Arthrobacter sp. P2b TaxID=1938741 RepID=UPI0009CAE56E|nr:hypothetical protein [Arthrobacter sp. P2b]SLK10583.1 hypothetical protein SAMN06272721_11375 [Arthrobacter sp. P2b]
MITSINVGTLMVSAVLIGLGLGAEGDVAAYMASRYFPQHSYGRVLGFIYFRYAQGSAVRIFILGQLHQAFGTSAAALIPLLGMIAISIVCLLFMGPYRFTLKYGQVQQFDAQQDNAPHVAR